jgi:hypothetical protein
MRVGVMVGMAPQLDGCVATLSKAIGETRCATENDEARGYEGFLTGPPS